MSFALHVDACHCPRLEVVANIGTEEELPLFDKKQMLGAGEYSSCIFVVLAMGITAHVRWDKPLRIASS